MHLPAAQAWDRYEGACSTLLPQPGHGRPSSTATPPRSPSRASRRTTSSTDGFLRDGELLADVPRIRHLPVHDRAGPLRHRVPAVTADELARAWPEAEYVVVPDAGHSVREPGITRELVAAVRRMQQRLA